MHLLSEKTFTSSLGVIDYLQAGQGDTVIIFLHGWIGWPMYATSFVYEYAPLGYTVILPYLPSHGKSFGLKTTQNFLAVVAAMKEFVQQFANRNIVIVGHSFGGGVAWRLAQETKNIISRMVLIDPYLRYEGESYWELIVRWIKSSLIDVWGKSKADTNPELENKFVLPQPGTIKNGLQMLRSINQTDKRINLPILALWGDRDYMCPYDSYLDILARADNLVLEKMHGSHYWFLAKKHQLFELITNFLK